MTRCCHWPVRVLAAAALALGPLAATAQELPPGSGDFTPEQLRAAFVRGGYAVDQPLTWDWTNPPLTTFRVYDPSFDRRPSAELPPAGRVLMVLVYPDMATARAVQLRAHARDQAQQLRELTFTQQRGPHLIPGYGPSAWVQNVALVQSTQTELERPYAAEIDRDTQVVVRTGPDDGPASQALDWPAGRLSPPALVWSSVDDDFLAAVRGASRIDL